MAALSLPIPTRADEAFGRRTPPLASSSSATARESNELENALKLLMSADWSVVEQGLALVESLNSKEELTSVLKRLESMADAPFNPIIYAEFMIAAGRRELKACLDYVP